MNKFYSIFIVLLLLQFSGCTPSTSLEYFSNNPKNAYAIQYTKKRDIVYKNEVKAMIFATYLNKISPEYKTDDFYSFLIGIHYENGENRDLVENKFFLTLNDEEPENLMKLKKDSKLLENITLKNQWAEYYLVDYKSEEDLKNLNLKFYYPVWGETVINFQK